MPKHSQIDGARRQSRAMIALRFWPHRHGAILFKGTVQL